MSFYVQLYEYVEVYDGMLSMLVCNGICCYRVFRKIFSSLLYRLT